MSLEFGVFQGASVGPRPWGDREARRIRQDIEVGIAADRAGFDTFWAPEHHCLEEYSHNSSSHLSCLAVGLQTQRIRVVTGIFNLCPPINHPIRVAEQIAMIDILTNGRVELGTGRGSGSTEVNSFGVAAGETRAMWEEAIRAIPKMWTQDLFSWDGTYFTVPERCVLPKPVQRPHPPLWVTASNPGTVETAGRMGIGAAMFNFADPELSRPLVEGYKRAIQKAEPVGEFVYDKIMTIAPAMCLEDGEEARALYNESAGRIAAHFSVYFDTIPAFAERFAKEPRPIAQTRLRELIRELAASGEATNPFAIESLEPDYLRQNGICVGTPAEVIATLRRFEAVGFDQVVVVPVVGFDTPHEKTLESVRLLGEKVLPVFRRPGR